MFLMFQKAGIIIPERNLDYIQAEGSWRTSYSVEAPTDSNGFFKLISKMDVLIEWVAYTSVPILTKELFEDDTNEEVTEESKSIVVDSIVIDSIPNYTQNLIESMIFRGMRESRKKKITNRINSIMDLIKRREATAVASQVPQNTGGPLQIGGMSVDVRRPVTEEELSAAHARLDKINKAFAAYNITYAPEDISSLIRRLKSEVDDTVIFEIQNAVNKSANNLFKVIGASSDAPASKIVYREQADKPETESKQAKPSTKK